MKLDRIHQIAEIIASVAIVASLIFVGLQLRQNTRALETNAAQTYSQTWQDQTLTLAANPQLAQAYFNRMRNPPYASPEEAQVANMVQAQLKSMEFNFLQWRDGNLSDEIFEPTRRGYGYYLLSMPLAEYWASVDDGPFTEAFVAFTKEVLADAKRRAARESSAVGP